jgi:putative FmdB family regulatory protein
MPVYDYECTKCGHRFELTHAVNKEPRKRCPECKGKIKKCFASVGVVFKGSGFYCTDSRGKSGGGKAACASCESPKAESKPECAAVSGCSSAKDSD